MAAPRGESSRFNLMAVLSMVVLMSACATLDISLQPPSFKSEEYAQSARKGLELRAIPIEGVDRYWELFDDYLPEVGIAAVWTVVRNTGEFEIDLSKSRWELRSRGRICAALTVDQIFKLYYKRRKIRLYSLHSDRKARTRFAASSQRPSILQPRSEQAGFLLFDIAPSSDPDWGSPAVLALQNVHLTKGIKTDIVLSLTHANTNR